MHLRTLDKTNPLTFRFHFSQFWRVYWCQQMLALILNWSYNRHLSKTRTQQRYHDSSSISYRQPAILCQSAKGIMCCSQDSLIRDSFAATLRPTRCQARTVFDLHQNMSGSVLNGQPHSFQLVWSEISKYHFTLLQFFRSFLWLPLLLLLILLYNQDHIQMWSLMLHATPT